MTYRSIDKISLEELKPMKPWEILLCHAMYFLWNTEGFEYGDRMYGGLSDDCVALVKQAEQDFRDYINGPTDHKEFIAWAKANNHILEAAKKTKPE